MRRARALIANAAGELGLGVSVTRIASWTAVIATLFLAAAPAVAAPLEVYGKLPSIEQAALSPDGSLIAVALTDGEARNVVVIRAQDKGPLVTLKAGTSKIRDLKWAGPNHLLITASTTTSLAEIEGPRREWLVSLDYNLKTGAIRDVLKGPKNTLTAALSEPSVRVIDGTPFAFVDAWYFVGEYGRDSLFKVDLDHDKTTLAVTGWPNTETWVVGPNGEALAEAEYDSRAGKWTLAIKQGGTWREAMTMDADYGFGGALGLGRDGQSVMIESETKDNKDAFQEFDTKNGKWADPFAVMDNAEPIFDPVDGRLIGLHDLIGDADVYRFFTPSDQAAWDAAAKPFAGQRVTLQSLSADHHKLVLLTDSPAEGPAYAFVDVDAHRAYFIGPTYNDLKPDDIAPVRTLAFKAADGLPLTGYLTLPRGRDAKDLPLIVFPHGGPAARDEPGFDWWTQAMASRGYAVLQVNYRGSGGFDWNLLKAGYGEWGRKMQTDLSDGVRYLAAQGTIDPKRVCIVGGSYGGYAALAGATLDTGVYRCAVSVAGPSDLRNMVAWSKDRAGISAQRYWDRFMGAKGVDDPRLQDISPADHADRVTIPILLIHGKDDTVVPFEQSILMANALKERAKPYEFVVLNHEDHWLSRGETRLQMLKATMDFVEKNNPPQ
jgi:dipeptidyl aminopeptidase/acylaminoacyl peptidase